MTHGANASVPKIPGKSQQHRNFRLLVNQLIALCYPPATPVSLG